MLVKSLRSRDRAGLLARLEGGQPGLDEDSVVIARFGTKIAVSCFEESEPPERRLHARAFGGNPVLGSPPPSAVGGMSHVFFSAIFGCATSMKPTSISSDLDHVDRSCLSLCARAEIFRRPGLRRKVFPCLEVLQMHAGG